MMRWPRMSPQLENSVGGVAAGPAQAALSTAAGAAWLRPPNAEINPGMAKKNGYQISDRGRLPAEVLQAWQTAGSR